MSEVQDAAKTLFDYLKLALRYVSAGFISLITLMMIDPTFEKFCTKISEKSIWLILFEAATVGIMIYAFHHSVMDKMFYGISIWIYRRKYKLPATVETDISNWETTLSKKGHSNKHTNNKRFVLASQTFLRKYSGDSKVVGIQSLIDEKLALLMFMYGAFYCMVSISSFYLFIHWAPSCNPFYDNRSPNVGASWLVFVFGWLVLFASISFDYRITKREMWLVQYFAQSLKKKKVIFSRTFNDTKTSVHLAGSFSQWQRIPLSAAASGTPAVWSVELEIEPGPVFYKFLINGNWEEGNDLWFEIAPTAHEPVHI